MFLSPLVALPIELKRRLVVAALGAPPSVLRRLAGPPRTSPEGFVMDLQTQALLRLDALVGKTEWHEIGVLHGRRTMDVSARLLAARPAGALSVFERRIPVDGAFIRARVYRPMASGDRLPIVVFFHGGGAVLGSLDSHDGECRAIALGARAVVAAIDYRLAPEHKFPIPVDDSAAAFRWVVRNADSLGGDPDRVAVAGDSAGGNIAAVVARDTRGEEARPMFQLLIYPALDFTCSFPSHVTFCEGVFPTRAGIRWFIDNYTRGPSDWTDPRASPVLAAEHRGLPPATILTAGFDPLRDEGKAYADRLAAAGVPVDYRCYEGLVHGFFSMSAAVDAARRALKDAVSALRRAFGSRHQMA